MIQPLGCPGKVTPWQWPCWKAAGADLCKQIWPLHRRSCPLPIPGPAFEAPSPLGSSPSWGTGPECQGVTQMLSGWGGQRGI